MSTGDGDAAIVMLPKLILPCLFDCGDSWTIPAPVSPNVDLTVGQVDAYLHFDMAKICLSTNLHDFSYMNVENNDGTSVSSTDVSVLT